MISSIASQGHVQGASRAQRPEAKPVEARPQPTSKKETAASAAAVVQISSKARALSSEANQASAAQASAQSEPRPEVRIQPVVAQPVPDFNGSKAETTASTPQNAPSASGFQALA
jgi:hypothetical protein